MYLNQTLATPQAACIDRSVSQSFSRVLLGMVFLILCAKIKLFLPFTPVPLTLQTFGVLLLGSLLGSKQGALSVIGYIALSICGLPVLATIGIPSLALIGPTGGYLVGMVIQAYVVGLLWERTPKFKNSTLFLGMILSCLMQLTVGSLWLANFISFDKVWLAGFYPFLPGELLKVLAISSLSSLRK